MRYFLTGIILFLWFPVHLMGIPATLLDSLQFEIDQYTITANEDSNLAQLHYDLAMEYYKSNDTEKAIKSSLTAISYAPSNSNLEFYCHNSLGDFFLQSEDYVNSLTSFQSALKIANYLNDPIKQGMVYYNLHIHFDHTKNKDLSNENLKRSYTYLKESKDTARIIKVLNAMAQMNASLDQFDEAQSYYQNALQKAYDYNDSNLISFTYTNFSTFHFVQGDTVEGLHLLRFSYQIDQKIGKTSDKVITAYNIGSIYKKQGKLDSAVIYFQQAFEYAELGNHLTFQKIINKSLFKMYYQMNQYDSLPVMFYAYTHITDSIYSKNEMQKYLEAQNEIELLQKDNELKLNRTIQKENRQKLLMLSLFLAILGIVLIGLFIARSSLNKQKNELEVLYEKTKRQNNKIENQKSLLEKTNNELKKNAEGKDRIMSLLAHDLRTPLSSIHSLNYLIKSTGSTNEKQDKFIDTSNKVVIGGLDLISDILDIYKLENLDNFDLDLLQISALLNNSIEKMIPNTLIKKQTIIGEFEPDLEFLTNREMIQSAVDNLLSNASKYSGPETQITLKAAVEKDQLLIEIIDEGQGFTSEEIEVLFDRFNKFSRSVISTETSTGLGLFLVKGFVEKLNGTIKVESKPEKGTKFILTFKAFKN